MAMVALVFTACGDDAGSGEGGSDGGGGGEFDGARFTEVYSCNESFGGGPLSCPDLNESDVLVFTSTGGDDYEVRDHPDMGYVYTGTLTGDDFAWTGVSPNGYTEVGTWTFDAARTEFSGSSVYTADDNSYAGDCNETGAASGTPPDPPAPTGC
jgi:hypothetical protein